MTTREAIIRIIDEESADISKPVSAGRIADRILALTHAEEDPGLRDALGRIRSINPDHLTLDEAISELHHSIRIASEALATPPAQSSGAEAKREHAGEPVPIVSPAAKKRYACSKCGREATADVVGLGHIDDNLEWCGPVIEVKP